MKYHFYKGIIINRSFLACIFLCFLALTLHAQDNDKLFGPTEKPHVRKGFLLSGNISGDIPAGDMAKEFGNSLRIGGSVLYKTNNNWLFGAKCDFITGNMIKVDSLCINIRDKYSGFNGKLIEFINDNGSREGVPVYERGYLIGLQAGKIISTNPRYPDNGLELLTSAGFIQHKIDIYNDYKDVYQLRGQYLKGYDRLTNGSFAEQYVGYVYFSKSRLINFNAGLDFLFALTRDRRSYLYDVMRSDNQQRKDILMGIRGGWTFAIFKRKSEELNFE